MSDTIKNRQIGKFCSVAKKGTMIIPKTIKGYDTPAGQVLKEDGQKFNFYYTPTKYNITYDLKGGKLESEYKTIYTIEDEDYTPPTPIREDYTFSNWNPKSIPSGSVDDVNFIALWKPNCILKTGKELNKIIDEFVGGKENVLAIQSSYSIPTGIYINLSCTENPIYASFSNGILSIYAADPIYCNLDMSYAFEGFTLLRDIACLVNWTCKENTNIKALFRSCSLLSDLTAINNWAFGKFSDFTDAFKDTSAMAALRVPGWYRWSETIKYISSTGIEIESITEPRIPNEVIYSKSINGYTAITKQIEITKPNSEYTFHYEPNQYQISYELRGGELLNPKTTYTIEDESYYPPEPVKPGFTFISWDPECIEQGEFGNVTFIANYK